jgi:hypothetical protein
LSKRLIGLACFLASTALAQIGGGYLGPGVLSSGASGVGNRSGQQVDLRFFAGVNGVYDSSLSPTSVNANGTLTTVNGLYGVEANVGLYGTHSWKTAQLGIDYRGTFREYDGDSAYDGIDQFLTLGYTWQESRRLVLKANALAGTLSDGLAFGILPQVTGNEVATPTTLLFDNRSYYLQGGLDATFVQSARTSYTFGAGAFDVWRQSAALIGVEGYNARGTVEHRLNKTTSIGFTYQRQHFDFPKVFGQSNIDTGELFLATNIGRRWQFIVRGGIFHAEVSGLEQVALNPVIAALLGQTAVIQSFYKVDYYPSGQLSLSRQFKAANLTFSYGQSVAPGNGVYLTSKSDNGIASYSYTGIRKLNLGISGGYSSLNALGQGIAPYRTAFGGAGFSYSLPKALHLIARYDYRYQEIESFTYKHTGNRVTLGLSFSPGTLPLSLW